MVLCPWCHDEATKGAMREDEQRHWKKHPFNVERGYAHGRLVVQRKAQGVLLGSNISVGKGSLLRVDGQDLLSFYIGPVGNAEISVALFDQEDNELALIDRNE